MVGFGKESRFLKYIKLIKDTYNEVEISVRTSRAFTSEFPATIDFHEESH